MWHPSCACFCLLSYLLVWFLLLYMHFRACPIFCNNLMLGLIVFCKQIVHICIVWIYAGCCRCHFVDFVTFCARIFLFVALTVDLWLLICCLLFCVPQFSFSWCFFGSFPACFFLLCKSAGYINLRVLVFVFLCDVVCFFALILLLTNHIAPRTRCSVIFPPLYPLWPPWPSLLTTWCFLARDHTWKYVLIAVFCLVSACFLAPPCTYALLYPCEPLRTHPVPFAPILRLFCKTWCSGKFPRP